MSLSLLFLTSLAGTIPNLGLEWLSPVPARRETSSTQSPAGWGPSLCPASDWCSRAALPLAGSFLASSPSGPYSPRQPIWTPTAQGAGREDGAGLRGRDGRMGRGLAALRKSGRPMAREGVPGRAPRGRAGPGQSRATGRVNAGPGRPARGTGGGGQWAGSWCVTGEFLKGEVSGATGRVRGAVVRGGGPPRFKIMPAAPARPCNGERLSWGWCSSGLASMECCGSSSGWGPAWASTSVFRSASAFSA